MGECSLHVIDFPTQSYCVNSVPIELCLLLWEECLNLPKECLWQDVTSHSQHSSLLLHSKALCKQPRSPGLSSWTIIIESQGRHRVAAWPWIQDSIESPWGFNSSTAVNGWSFQVKDYWQEQSSPTGKSSSIRDDEFLIEHQGPFLFHEGPFCQS